jgi:hypothetical protein
VTSGDVAAIDIANHQVPNLSRKETLNVTEASIIRPRSLSMIATLAILLAACGDNSLGPIDEIPLGTAEIGADIAASRTLYAETTYVLTKYVHVTSGATLTIRPGTTIQGRPGSALFVLRGARVDARGTAEQPIVMTSAEAVGARRPGDWGGLIVVGNGIINRTGTVELEGTGSPVENYVVTYNGGNNNDDNSGTLQYVRVEFAGFGVAADQELNSFTFAAVGRGTTLDHLQSLAGLDDSFEWFGGAVDGKFLVSYESGDDHFDAAEGYIGRNQYLLAFQSTVLDPRAGSGVLSRDPQGFEIDGCGSATGSGCSQGFNSTPLNTPMFANFTMVGTGPIPAIVNNSGGVGLLLRRGTAGHFVNGILARWPRAAISLRDSETQTRYTDGELIIRNVAVVETGATAGSNALIFEAGTACPASNCRFTVDASQNGLQVAGGDVTAASIFTALPATPSPSAAPDFSLTASAAQRSGGSGAFTGALATKGGSFIAGTSYLGAWDPTTGAKWWQGWTTYARQ